MKYSCTECGCAIGFAGVCYRCCQERKKAEYESLSAEEIAARYAEIEREIRETGDLREHYEAFAALLGFCETDTAALAQAAFENRLYWPPELYRDASEEVQNGLIALLETEQNLLTANHVLQALAVCGSETVRQAFVRWKANPPAWRKRMHVDTDVYAQQGGWTFDVQGKRRELVYRPCFALDKGGCGAVKVAVPREDVCADCGCRSVDLLDIDGSDSRLAFLNVRGRMRLPVCPSCVGLSDKTVIRYDENGGAEYEIIGSFGEENQISPEEYGQFAANGLQLSSAPKQPYYVYGGEFSAIGGMPDWEQEPQYESCPDCGKTMKQLAVLREGQLRKCGDGSLYVQHCSECRVAVVFAQYT